MKKSKNSRKSFTALSSPICKKERPSLTATKAIAAKVTVAKSTATKVTVEQTIAKKAIT